jgi:hypothetical protein
VHRLDGRERERCLEAISHYLNGCDEILFSYAHGSFAAGRPFRDVDVALWLRPDRAPSSPFHYEDELSEAVCGAIRSVLQRNLPVDVRILNETPIPFQFRVFQGRVLTSADDDFRLDRVEYVISRYLDMKPLLHQAVKDILHGGSPDLLPRGGAQGRPGA